ncbi:hypothetical protein J2Z50_006433 [Ensifer mexicanus]|nr:hypothetical protein [Sinorhizobium mexicanum]
MAIRSLALFLDGLQPGDLCRRGCKSYLVRSSLLGHCEDHRFQRIDVVGKQAKPWEAIENKNSRFPNRYSHMIVADRFQPVSNGRLTLAGRIFFQSSLAQRRHQLRMVQTASAPAMCPTSRSLGLPEFSNSGKPRRRPPNDPNTVRPLQSKVSANFPAPFAVECSDA